MRRGWGKRRVRHGRPQSCDSAAGRGGSPPSSHRRPVKLTVRAGRCGRATSGRTAAGQEPCLRPQTFCDSLHQCAEQSAVNLEYFQPKGSSLFRARNIRMLYCVVNSPAASAQPPIPTCGIHSAHPTPDRAALGSMASTLLSARFCPPTERSQRAPDAGQGSAALHEGSGTTFAAHRLSCRWSIHA
jgi:hypothetical protein